jgi:hypothetical protein
MNNSDVARPYIFVESLEEFGKNRGGGAWGGLVAGVKVIVII